MKCRLAALVLIATSSLARAQPPARRPIRDDAGAYLERGEAFFETGEFARALAEFDAGERLDPHPDFLYARGQAYRMLGDCPTAVRYYRAFLATRPPKSELPYVRDNLQRCGVYPPAPWYRDPLGGILAGAGAVGLAAGTTYLVLGERSTRSANRATTRADIEELGDRASRQRTLGAVGLALGGALIAGAAVRYALVARRHRAGTSSRAAFSISPAPRGLAVTWTGGF